MTPTLNPVKRHHDHCREVRLQMSGYLDGDLDPSAVKGLERHARSCPNRRRMLTNLWHTLGGIVLGAVTMAVVGAIDDRFELPAAVKLAGQIAAAAVPVGHGVVVHSFTVPFLGPVERRARSPSRGWCS